MVVSTQSRDKLEDRRSENDKVPTIVWKEYEAKRKKEDEEREKGSDSKREKDCEMSSK